MPLIATRPLLYRSVLAQCAMHTTPASSAGLTRRATGLARSVRLGGWQLGWCSRRVPAWCLASRLSTSQHWTLAPAGKQPFAGDFTDPPPRDPAPPGAQVVSGERGLGSPAGHGSAGGGRSASQCPWPVQRRRTLTSDPPTSWPSRLSPGAQCLGSITCSQRTRAPAPSSPGGSTAPTALVPALPAPTTWALLTWRRRSWRRAA